jgi:hypothetical protein
MNAQDLLLGSVREAKNHLEIVLRNGLVRSLHFRLTIRRRLSKDGPRPELQA